MLTVNVHQAKTQLSKLIARVEGGEEVVIARAGRAVVRMVPERAPEARRVPGALRGELQMTDEFEAPLSDEELTAWGA